MSCYAVPSNQGAARRPGEAGATSGTWGRGIPPAIGRLQTMDPEPPIAYLIGVMPASVPSPSSMPARDVFSTRDERDIHPGVRPGLRLALILVAAFMVVLDFSIVNV